MCIDVILSAVLRAAVCNGGRAGAALSTRESDNNGVIDARPGGQDCFCVIGRRSVRWFVADDGLTMVDAGGRAVLIGGRSMSVIFGSLQRASSFLFPRRTTKIDQIRHLHYILYCAPSSMYAIHPVDAEEARNTQ